jgi:hypothetical protein
VLGVKELSWEAGQAWKRFRKAGFRRAHEQRLTRTDQTRAVALDVGMGYWVGFRSRGKDVVDLTSAREEGRSRL